MTKNSKRTINFDGPILDKIRLNFDSVDFTQHPFSLDIIKTLQEVVFPTQVTFFIGENGAGKSTILEAIAEGFGFGAEGGSKNISFKTAQEETFTSAQQLADCMIYSWRLKPMNGYFFRAESFYNVATAIDSIGDGIHSFYGGKSLHAQSHGEGFLSFFNNRLGQQGFFIFDEPEAALSPQRQLVLLNIMHDVCKNPQSQFIIATHSPMLLAYPNATIYSCDSGRLTKVNYKDTDHYQITKNFLNNPDSYLRHLLDVS